MLAHYMKKVLHVCCQTEKQKMNELLLHIKTNFIFKNSLAFPYSSFCQNSLISVKNREHISLRYYSRVPKSWFRLKKKSYDIVDVYEVSPKKNVPSCIKRPDYADSGVTNEPDMINIMDAKELQCMRQSCGLAKLILEEVAKTVTVGVSTDDLDAFAHNLCINYGAYPSPLNYRGYPKSICTSVNNIACHGIPDSRKLLDGDVISIDISVFHNGYHGDCAATYCVGNVDEKGKKLVEVASQCLYAAIEICHPNQSLCQIGKTISDFARNHGFSVVPAFCGHGIGSSFHSPPKILHYDNDEDGEMQKGMVFTIEPVISEGRPDIVILEDGWTAASEDDSRSAQFEHTILITETGPEILTVSSAFKSVER